MIRSREPTLKESGLKLMRHMDSRYIDEGNMQEVAILSHREIYVSSSLEEVEDAMLASGVHLVSRTLDRKLGMPEDKKEVETDSDSDSSSDSEDEDDQPPTKQRKVQASSDSEPVSDRTDAKETDREKTPKSHSSKRKRKHKPTQRATQKQKEKQEQKEIEARAARDSFVFWIERFARMVLRNWLVYGFSPWTIIEHPAFGQMPSIQSLDDTKVEFKIDNNQEYHYHLTTRKPTGSYHQSMDGIEVKTAGFITLDGPGPNGELRSLVATLVPYAIQYATLARYAAMSEARLANPTFLTTTSGSGSTGEVKTGDVRRSNTVNTADLARDQAWSESYEQCRKEAKAESDLGTSLVAQYTGAPSNEKGLRSAITRIIPRPNDNLAWFYTIQDCTGVDSKSITVPNTKPTTQTVNDYNMALSQVVRMCLGLPTQSDSSSNKGMFQTKNKNSTAVSDTPSPRFRAMQLRWGRLLEQFVSYILEEVCGLSDVQLQLVSLINESKIWEHMESGCLKITPQLSVMLNQLTRIPKDCFVSATEAKMKADLKLEKQRGKLAIKLEKLKAKQEEHKQELELKAQEETNKLEREKMQVELSFRKQELELKIEEARVKMQLATQQTAAKINDNRAKTACDIETQRAKTDADIQNQAVVSKAKADAQKERKQNTNH